MSADVRYGIVIPACNEADCIAAVIAELRGTLSHPEQYGICVGVNGSSDATAKLAREAGALVVETEAQGYGHGCAAAAAEIERAWPEVEAFIFFAGDGANSPGDIPRLIARFEKGVPMVLGSRTMRIENIGAMGLPHFLANRLLGAWCGVLTGRFFTDLGPLRLIERKAFHELALREMRYGWTIEAQVRAAMAGVRQIEVPVQERPRMAGEQKVSRVSWLQTLRVGCAIFVAGWGTRFSQV